MGMNIIEKFRRLNNLLNYGGNATIRVTEDLYAMELMGSLINREPYLPMSSMALRPYALASAMNELIVNGRKRIIEFGSGMSTILLGRLIKSNNLNAIVYSVDENQGWLDLLAGMIEKEDLAGIIKLYQAPLEGRTEMKGRPHWYNKNILTEKLGATTFDMVLIDGPTACNVDIAQSRYFALPFLKDRLNEQYVIFLDDADRKGEKEVLKAWQRETGLEFRIYANTLAVAYKGSHFVSNPMRFAPECVFN